MNTRSKLKRSLSPVVGDERLVTKKEMEEDPSRYKICPSVCKKTYYVSQYLKDNIYCSGDGNARPVFFDRPTTLSKLYDPSKKISYLCQVFTVCECIGEGSFGVVYKACNKEDGKFYAIKLMKRCSYQRIDYNEVRRVEKIGVHENLVKFYIAWVERRIVYMQLELCALSLATYTKTNHKLANSQLWDIFIDMLYALRHLHGHGLAHLDIKPDNIMMSKDGKYKLGDFGLLMDLNEQSTSNPIKSTQTSEGDAKYLAKEVLDGDFSTAADIFSLGISTLELASDIVLPGNGPLWHDLRDGTFSSNYFKLVPSRLRGVITKMMVPKPEQRPNVEQIILLNSVKKAIEERGQKLRTNYYTLWRAQNTDDNAPPPIAVCLNPKDTPPRVMENDDEDDDMGVAPLDSSACVTPPKCVSQVILYTI